MLEYDGAASSSRCDGVGVSTVPHRPRRLPISCCATERKAVELPKCLIKHWNTLAIFETAGEAGCHSVTPPCSPLFFPQLQRQLAGGRCPRRQRTRSARDPRSTRCAFLRLSLPASAVCPVCDVRRVAVQAEAQLSSRPI